MLLVFFGSCVQCVRRKIACIPQGDVQHATVPNLPCQSEATSVGDTGLVPFFQALIRINYDTASRSHLELIFRPRCKGVIRASFGHRDSAQQLRAGYEITQPSIITNCDRSGFRRVIADREYIADQSTHEAAAQSSQSTRHRPRRLFTFSDPESSRVSAVQKAAPRTL